MLCLSILSNLLRWLLPFLLFFFCINNAFSAQCTPENPKNSVYGVYCTGFGCYVGNPQQNLSSPTPAAACQSFASYSPDYNYVSATTDRCYLTRTSNGSDFDININFFGNQCAPGYTYDTGSGQCVSTCEEEEPCPEASSFFGGGSSEGESLTSCNGSCELTSGGSCISTTDPIQGTVTSTFCGGWRFTGNNCSTNNFTAGASPDGVPSSTGGRPTKPSDCPPQTGYAEVNGEASCLPSGSTVDGGTATSTDPTTGNTTTTDIKTTINPDGTRTTTTTTSIFDSGGALISTSTGTSTNSGISDGQGKEPQKIDLDFGESPTFDSTLPEEPQIQIKTQAGQTITTEVFSVAASCPADIVFEALGQEFTISFVPICDLADIIRGIILMLASIASIRIVVSS